MNDHRLNISNNLFIIANSRISRTFNFGNIDFTQNHTEPNHVDAVLDWEISPRNWDEIGYTQMNTRAIVGII